MSGVKGSLRHILGSCWHLWGVYGYRRQEVGWASFSTSISDNRGAVAGRAFQSMTTLPLYLPMSRVAEPRSKPRAPDQQLHLCAEPEPWAVGSGASKHGGWGSPPAPGLVLGLLRKALSTRPFWPLTLLSPGPCHQAGKFDIIPTMTTIGSGIGIFGVVSAEAVRSLCWGQSLSFHTSATNLPPQNLTKIIHSF